MEKTTCFIVVYTSNSFFPLTLYFIILCIPFTKSIISQACVWGGLEVKGSRQWSERNFQDRWKNLVMWSMNMEGSKLVKMYHRPRITEQWYYVLCNWLTTKTSFPLPVCLICIRIINDIRFDILFWFTYHNILYFTDITTWFKVDGVKSSSRYLCNSF